MKFKKYIVGKAESSNLEKIAIHPLNGNAKRKTRSLSDAAGLTKIGVHMNIIPPGRISTEQHSHEFIDEFIYILPGKATFYLDEEEYEVNSGDFIGFPAHGAAHTLKNIGNEDLVYLIGGNRADFDICNYPRLGKRLYFVSRPDGRYREFVDLDKLQKL